MKYKVLTVCAALAILISSCSKSQSGALNQETGKGTNKIEDVTSSPVGGNPNKDVNNIGGDKPPVDTSDRGGDDPRDPNCEGVYCTFDFRQIKLEIVDANNNPVMLDVFYTEDMAGNRLPTYLYEYNSYTSSYVVFNDGWMNGNQNSSIQVRFVGIKNGAVVVTEVYTIATDCCHIEKKSGKDKVVLP